MTSLQSSSYLLIVLCVHDTPQLLMALTLTAGTVAAIGAGALGLGALGLVVKAGKKVLFNPFRRSRRGRFHRGRRDVHGKLEAGTYSLFRPLEETFISN